MIAASDCPHGCAIWDNNSGHGFCALSLYDCDVAGATDTTAQTATCDVYIIPGDGTYICGSISNCPFACTVEASDSNLNTYQICGTQTECDALAVTAITTADSSRGIVVFLFLIVSILALIWVLHLLCK